MRLSTLLFLLAFSASTAFAQKFVGGDISLLPEYEEAKAIYLDHSGSAIASPLEFFKDEGMNAMRLRLFVNPSQYSGSDKDPNACQDIDYVKRLGKRIKDAGFKLMLDFHYSDTWADPAKQWTPAEWVGFSDTELYQKIYAYTKDEGHFLCANAIALTDSYNFVSIRNAIFFTILIGHLNEPCHITVVVGELLAAVFTQPNCVYIRIFLTTKLPYTSFVDALHFFTGKWALHLLFLHCFKRIRQRMLSYMK